MSSNNHSEAIRQLEAAFANCHHLDHDGILKMAANTLVQVIGAKQILVYQLKKNGDRINFVEALPSRDDVQHLKSLSRQPPDLRGKQYHLTPEELILRICSVKPDHWMFAALNVARQTLPDLKGVIEYFISRLEDCLETKFLEERKQILVNSHHSNLDAIQLFARTVELGATLTRSEQISLFLHDQKFDKLVLVATTGPGEVGGSCLNDKLVAWYRKDSENQTEIIGNSLIYRVCDSGMEESESKLGFIEITCTEKPDKSRFRNFEQYLEFASPFIAEAARQTTLYRSAGRKFTIRGNEKFLADLLQSIMRSLRLTSGCLMLLRPENRELSLISLISEGSNSSVNFRCTLDQKSLANRILESKEVYHTDNVEKSKAEFNEAGISALGIRGAFIGVPLVSGENAIGVMSFWANGLERHLGNYLQPFARLLSQLLTGNSEAEFLQRQEMYYSSLEARMTTHHEFSWLCDVIIFGVLASGVDRARIFEITDNSTKKRCLATFGHGPKPGFLNETFDLHGCNYIKHFKSNVFFDRSPRHYCSIDFGKHPLSETLEIDAHLTWMVIPLVLNGKVFGFLEVDNKITEKPLKGEISSLLDLTCRLTSRLADFNRQVDEADRANQLLDAIPTCVWEKNLNHEFVFVNAYFARQLGKELIYIKGRQDYDLFPRDLCIRYREGDLYVLKNNSIYHATEEFEDKDGERRSIEVFKSPKLNIHGEVIGTMGIWLDATELRRANAELEKTRDLLERAQVMAGMGSWEWNVTEKKVYPSQGLYDLFGLNKGTGTPSKTSDFVSAIKDQVGFFLSLLPLVREEIWDLIIDNVPVDKVEAVTNELMDRLPIDFDFTDFKELPRNETIEVTLAIEKEGKERLILAKCAQVDNSADTVFDAIAIDVTLQYEELQLREDLINEIHHRMRNNVIVLQEIIEAKIKDVETTNGNWALVKCLASITAAGEVHELLYEGRKTDINLKIYLTRLCKHLSEVYGAGDVTLRIECDNDAKDLELNPGRANALGLVVAELVSNTVKHSFCGLTPIQSREISIKISLSDNAKAQVIYSDSGRGFEKHVDLESASGLSMARRFVVSRLKGRIVFPHINESQVQIFFPVNTK